MASHKTESETKQYAQIIISKLWSIKTAPPFHCNNFVHSQPIFIIFVTYSLENLQLEDTELVHATECFKFPEISGKIRIGKLNLVLKFEF